MSARWKSDIADLYSALRHAVGAALSGAVIDVGKVLATGETDWVVLKVSLGVALVAGFGRYLQRLGSDMQGRP